MNFLVWSPRALIAALLCLSLSGCLPSGQSDQEEENEAHYLAGKSCLTAYDYHGAIECFEKAVEANPRSASAHLQLGCLYEEKEPDAAAAIYHYEQYLKLRPDSEKAEFVRQRIDNCKQDLATKLMPLPVPPGMQREFEQMAEDNKKLREENERLKAQLATRTAQPQADSTPPTNNRETPTPRTSTPQTVVHPEPPVQERTPPTSARTHVVRSGETLMAIARKYGVKLNDLLRANPGVDPRRMRPGITIKIPPG